MPSPVDHNQMIRDNPRVDPKLVDLTRAVLDTLRQAGFNDRGYTLAEPFTGQPVRLRDTNETSRVAHSGHR